MLWALFFMRLSFACAALTSFGPTEWSTSGHNYQIFIVPKDQNIINPPDGTPGGLTWADAMIAAHSMGGYLATIQSQNEQNFLMTMIYPWMYPKFCPDGVNMCCNEEPN